MRPAPRLLSGARANFLELTPAGREWLVHGRP
jgi:hypothetical protein